MRPVARLKFAGKADIRAFMATRQATVTTPLGDKLLFHRMTGREELGRLFYYDVELFSAKDDVNPNALLGEPMTVNVELPSGDLRHFQGYVSRFARVGWAHDYVVHRATLRPWLWLLTRRVNCRIFQNLSLPDVIKKVFADYGFADFEVTLTGTYPVREYVVQYRESDFAFVSRLMEEGGIYYFFKHTAASHTLVLVDDQVAHEPMPGYAEVPFYPPNTRVDEYFDHWTSTAEVQSGGVVLDDYNFKTPAATLLAERSDPRAHSNADLTQYEYPGGYEVAGDGSELVRVRVEEQQAEFERFQGDASCRGLAAGYTFALTKYPRADQNKSYLAIAAGYTVASESYESQRIAGPREDFRCSVTALDAKVAFRPLRSTPRPRMSGPQTATVVGRAGEEIWTDEHGRVRLQFHWDREGKSDEESSCWVRVGQIWAGGGFGAQFIPRIGQEVIVDFLGGDPDRPIIVGSVYNGFNQPPFPLPQNATQSGIKTQSSKGGSTSNANIIRFEDKIGSEQLYVQAEKNKDVLVKANRSANIGDSDLLEITKNRDKKIGKNETIDVGENRKATIVGNDTTIVQANQDKTIIGNVTDTVMGNITETVGGSRTETIVGALTQTVTGPVTLTTPAAVTVSAGGGFTVVAPGGTKTIDSFFDQVGGKLMETFQAKWSNCGLKFDTVPGISMSMVNNKVDMVGMKVDMTRAKIANKNQITLENYKTAIMQGYVNLHGCTLFVIQ
jgi:type VI secretion system secreted protein VgrG